MISSYNILIILTPTFLTSQTVKQSQTLTFWYFYTYLKTSDKHTIIFLIWTLTIFTWAGQESAGFQTQLTWTFLLLWTQFYLSLKSVLARFYCNFTVLTILGLRVLFVCVLDCVYCRIITNNETNKHVILYDPWQVFLAKRICRIHGTFKGLSCGILM